MIASWIAKRMVQTGFDVMKQDDFDVAAMMKQWADDAVYDVGTELGIGETSK